MGDYVHAGDVTGDGFADLIFGHVVDDTTVSRPGSGAPKVGAHDDEVYGGLLGLSDDARAPLRRDRVI